MITTRNDLQVGDIITLRDLSEFKLEATEQLPSLFKDDMLGDYNETYDIMKVVRSGQVVFERPIPVVDCRQCGHFVALDYSSLPPFCSWDQRDLNPPICEMYQDE